MPAVFHTGHSGIGSGMPGGGGIRLKYSNPMYVDDVAVDFPAMPIVLAHPSFPWQEEALSVAMHKPQVYIDLSGWAPKLFPPILVQYVNGPLRTKALFGSDYPVLTPDRWLAEFADCRFATRSVRSCSSRTPPACSGSDRRRPKRKRPIRGGGPAVA